MSTAQDKTTRSKSGVKGNGSKHERHVLDAVWPFNSSPESRLTEWDSDDSDGLKRMVAALAVSINAEANVSGAQAAETQRLLGQLVASISAIHERLNDRQRESRESEERIRSEAAQAEERIKEALRALKDEGRDRQQVVSARLEVLEAQDRKRALYERNIEEEVAKVRSSLADLQSRVDASVSELKWQLTSATAPIENIVSFHRRVAAILAFVLSFGLVAWAVFGSTVAGIIQRVAWGWLGWH